MLTILLIMIVMDMDPGIDDAVALIIALKNLNIKAITTVTGNVDSKQGAINALKITRYLAYNTPIYIGAYKPLKREPYYAKDIHGEDGLWNLDLGVYKYECLLLNNSIYSNEVIATAPLTNIAGINNTNIKLYLMGGIYDYNYKGNVTPFAEFNFYVDPDAAEMVLKRLKNIIAFGLDTTGNKLFAIDNGILDKIYNINNKYARLIYKVLRHPIDRFRYFNLHDIMPVLYYIEPSIFEFKRLKVSIDQDIRGRCVLEENGNIKVCSYIDNEAFHKLFIELIK